MFDRLFAKANSMMITDQFEGRLGSSGLLQEQQGVLLNMGMPKGRLSYGKRAPRRKGLRISQGSGRMRVKVSSKISQEDWGQGWS